jgi:hypothetical protein
MFNLKKAAIPAPMNTSKHNRTIGRRVSPNTTNAFSTDIAPANILPMMASGAIPIYCEGSRFFL